MKKNLITITILLTSTGLAVANEESHTVLQEINVYSAYAAPVNQDLAASSVTVLTEEDFTKRNATYVSDALKTLPSMAFSASGGRGALSNFYLRGADANHTVVVIDGVKMNPVTGYGFDFGALSLNNIDRIEVLRGEQSALWGSDAMGGVIYITTKSGLYKEKPFNIDFDLGTGSHGTYNGSATLSGYHDGFYYALHGNSHKTRGISAYSANKFYYQAKDGTKVESGGAVEKDKFHRDNGSLRVGYDKDNKGIELLVSHFTQSVHYDGSLADETKFDDYTRTRETLFKSSGYWGSEKTLFKHKAGISHIKTDSNTFSSNPSAYDAKKLNANYQLDINFDREGYLNQAVSVLGEYQKSQYNSSSYQNEKSLSEKNAVTEYRLFTEDDHSLAVSGRYTDSSQYENAITGRIAVAYRLSPNFRSHASFGSAIQNPSMTEYYGWSGTYLANPSLKPEKSKGGDLGLLMEFYDKRHRVDVTYFARNVDSLISSETVDPVNFISRAINVEGTSKIKGIELTYNGNLTDKLTAYTNYTFTRTKNNTGVELVRRPKHMANVGVAYQVIEPFGVNINFAYMGNRVDNYYNEVTFASSKVKMPSYTLVNLGANYQLTENLNLYANLTNLFDKKYEHTIGYGQYGRNVYVGLKGTF